MAATNRDGGLSEDYKSRDYEYYSGSTMQAAPRRGRAAWFLSCDEGGVMREGRGVNNERAMESFVFQKLCGFSLVRGRSAAEFETAALCIASS